MKKVKSIRVEELTIKKGEQRAKEEGKNFSKYIEELILNDYKWNKIDPEKPIYYGMKIDELLELADVPWVEKNGKLLK